jgi:rubrerythrin
MPSDTSSQRIAKRLRKLAADNRFEASNLQDVRDALARCASELMTPYEWAKMRARLVAMIERSRDREDQRSAILDALAEACDERRYPRRDHSDSIRDAEI